MESTAQTSLGSYCITKVVVRAVLTGAEFQCVLDVPYREFKLFTHFHKPHDFSDPFFVSAETRGVSV